jgi:hypothetical protein
MKKLTRDRVVPTISARVSCVMFEISDSGSPGLPYSAINKKNSRQALFAGVEKLINKVGLDSHAAGQKKRHEEVGDGMLLVHHTQHLISLNLERCTSGDGSGSGHMHRADACQRLLSNEVAGPEKRYCCFFAVLRNDREFCATLLKIENAVCGNPLRKKTVFAFN